MTRSNASSALFSPEEKVFNNNKNGKLCSNGVLMTLLLSALVRNQQLCWASKFPNRKIGSMPIIDQE
jgi:hypothetical protein